LIAGAIDHGYQFALFSIPIVTVVLLLGLSMSGGASSRFVFFILAAASFALVSVYQVARDHHYCVGPHSIELKDGTRGPHTTYGWDSVTAIERECRIVHTKGSNDISHEVTIDLHDGTRLAIGDAALNLPSLPRVWKVIVRARELRVPEILKPINCPVVP
jgi:hypothetical protein